MTRGLTRAVVLAAWVACKRDPAPAVEPARDAAPKPAASCITDADLHMVTDQVIAEIRTALHRDPSEQPVAVEARCDKRVLRFAGERIVVFRDPKTGALSAIASADTVKTAGCLDARITAATALVSYGRVLIDDARTAAGSAWLDPDIGALRWTACATSDPTDDASTLLHELNHGLARGDCLHVPGAAPLCFEQLDGLPARSVARLAPLPLPAGAARDAYQTVHDVYLGASGSNSAVVLFDELVAYTITLDVEAARAARHLAPHRPAMMPMFAFLTLHYLELVAVDHPAVLRTNRAAFERLFARAAESWHAWLDVRGAKTAFTDAEDVWWTRSEALRAKVLRN